MNLLNALSDYYNYAQKRRSEPGIASKFINGLVDLPHDVYQSGRMDVGPEEALPYSLNALSGGMAAAKPNSLGIFGGKLAKTADLTALKDAQMMEKANIHPDEIWNKTGWERSRNGKWQFEIKDSNARITNPLPQAGDSEARLGFHFSHPELEQAYPNIMDSTGIFGLPKESRNKGVFSEGRSIGLREDMPANEQRSTILHELEHAVSRREGRDPGSNPDNYSVPASKQDLLDRSYQARFGVQQKLDLIQDKAVRYLKKQGSHAGEMRDTPYLQEYKKWLDYKRNLDSMQRRIQDQYDPFNQYRRNAGEAQARNVQERDRLRMMPPPGPEGFTWEEVGGTGGLGDPNSPLGSPRLTEDIPRKNQSLFESLTRLLGD